MSQIIRAVVAIFLFTTTGSCSVPPTPEPPTPKPTPTTFVRQPIPFGPRIGGEVSGLLNSDDLVTTHLYDEAGHEVSYGTRSGNGHWEMVIIPMIPNKEYIITVEASDYSSQPISYTVSFDSQGDPAAKIVSDLDFHFTPHDP